MAMKKKVVKKSTSTYTPPGMVRDKNGNPVPKSKAAVEYMERNRAEAKGRARMKKVEKKQIKTAKGLAKKVTKATTAKRSGMLRGAMMGMGGGALGSYKK